MFSVTVLHDDRIVLVAEQRPDASEEDSFQWMSRVLQVGLGPRLRRPWGVEQELGPTGAVFPANVCCSWRCCPEGFQCVPSRETHTLLLPAHPHSFS